MIGYVTVGSNDMEKAERFYSSFLLPLGYHLEKYHGDLSYIPAKESGQRPTSPDFYVKAPFDKRSASAGNGSMVAFEANSQVLVNSLHAAALAAGGVDEGQPGFRLSYNANFFVGYLRDPDGNKIALYCDNPNEPGRDDRK